MSCLSSDSPPKHSQTPRKLQNDTDQSHQSSLGLLWFGGRNDKANGFQQRNVDDGYLNMLSYQIDAYGQLHHRL
jgi:hypothetical protein